MLYLFERESISIERNFESLDATPRKGWSPFYLRAERMEMRITFVNIGYDVDTHILITK